MNMIFKFMLISISEHRDGLTDCRRNMISKFVLVSISEHNGLTDCRRVSVKYSYKISLFYLFL